MALLEAAFVSAARSLSLSHLTTNVKSIRSITAVSKRRLSSGCSEIEDSGRLNTKKTRLVVTDLTGTFLWGLGLQEDDAECYDVYRLDGELLEMVPKPLLAVLFLYPLTTQEFTPDISVESPEESVMRQHDSHQNANLQGCAAGQKQLPSIPEMGSTSQDRKRKRFEIDVDEEAFGLQNQLIDVMERNGKMLADYFEAQNSHSQLDREQRKEHSDSLIAVLNKLADAFMRIADKL